MSSRALFTALFCLACASCASDSLQTAPSATATQASQRVRVVDEYGEPVPHAEVMLARGPLYDPEIVRTSTADENGWATFADLPQGNYSLIEAAAPPAWHVEWFEMGWHAVLPSDPIEVDVQELWIAGLDAPGERLITWRQVRANGYWSGAPHSWIYREAPFLPSIEPWPTRHENTAFYSGFRNPDQSDDTVELQIEWYGFEPHREILSMERLSRFDGPRALDASELKRCDWVELHVEVTESDGTVLTGEELAGCRLMRLDDIPLHRWYRIGSDGSVTLSCGEYELRRHLEKVGPLSITRETKSLKCRLPRPWRPK